MALLRRDASSRFALRIRVMISILFLKSCVTSFFVLVCNLSSLAFYSAKVWQACQIPNTSSLSAKNLFKQPSSIKIVVFLKRFSTDCLAY